jgi:small subunit ribosomal protein S6
LPYYENVFIARQDVSAVQVDGLIENFEKIITNAGGSIAKRENWGLRTMAYKIKKNRKGHYVLLNIDAPAPALHEMERQMRINEDILRYMTIRVDEHEVAPSAIMRNKDRDDRPRRDRGPRSGFSDDLPKPEASAKENVGDGT